ncbi:TMAO reductase system periplasmic protein TorT [Vibrio cholerae]|nr:TMAO reductase system periplasmic protein TorT [Vibrio cholerae]RBM45243.1 TMAO reductase system periplasmic protein TorT [Vibrio paracholerae]EGQ9390690.1 TMAO reductase system periplasmic protein TorT [Vibrio cholerae]EGR0539105.1 TMAO reductase system periplasmic protein TorT [Vibrio cholerae]EGR0604618.1 TMAO reductase system periplasmic protein TorT [Vibrio cholerae]
MADWAILCSVYSGSPTNNLMPNLRLHSFSLISALLLLSALPAAGAEKLCALYPHLKDSYWLSVNYGMVEEARKLNLNLRVMEAGGYPNHHKQQQQIALCVRWGADAILLGTVSPELYQDDLAHYTRSVPVFATVNQLRLNEQQQEHLKGEVGVDWYWMGFYAGEYLARKHPKGSGEIKIVVLPGPASSGGTKPVLQGLEEAIRHSDVRITEILWADNDKELQRNLIQQALEQPDVRYLVGSAVAIEAAISELRSLNKSDQIGLIATYLSHGVYRGLLRGRVEFAPTDQMVEQGRLSVSQAAAFLRNKPYTTQQAPKIEALTPKHLERKIIADSLSPSEYRPVFQVKAVE